MTAIWKAIAQQIGAATGMPFEIQGHRSVGGGSINSAYVIEGNNQYYFVKINTAALHDMFEAEMAGLDEIAAADVIRVPKAICSGVAGDSSFLVLECIKLGSGNGHSMSLLGQQLANMHHVSAEQFGWYRDNTIGATPQVNTYCHDWIEFYRDQRLGFQLDLLKHKGYGGSLQQQGERLRAALPSFFQSYLPKPALLHGDLWSGNYAIDEQGNPVIFDPAVYYGDREADLAMTELFGGFSGQFYAAYREAFPLDEGYEVRKTLYNLYHILNHLNLFGGSYLAQAERMMSQLLSEI